MLKRPSIRNNYHKNGAETRSFRKRVLQAMTRPLSNVRFGVEVPCEPHFHPVRPYYLQNNYLGRCFHFFRMIDPRNLSNSRLKAAIQVVKGSKGDRSISKSRTKNLWEARYVMDSCLHPDTGKPILRPFRLCAFLPMSVLVTTGMILGPATMSNQLFWQWFNQTFNAAFNFANRNASNHYTFGQVATSYGAATSIACGVSFGMDQLIKRASMFGPALKTAIKKTVPFAAVCTAGIANALIMRRSEATEGITLQLKDGTPASLARSKIAGKRALKQVALSRIALATPILVLPIILARLGRMPFMRVKPVAIAARLLVMAIVLGGAFPPAVSLFPQRDSVATEELEPEFHNIIGSNGKPAKELYYNKGI